MKFTLEKLRKLECNSRDIKFLKKIEPVLNMVEHGVPITKAVGLVFDDTCAYDTILKLITRGRELIDSGKHAKDVKGEDKCAIIIFAAYNYAETQLISEMTDIVYKEAVNKKSWKAAAELLKMRFTEYNAKSGLGENIFESTPISKIEIDFTNKAKTENQENRLKLLEEEARNDVV